MINMINSVRLSSGYHMPILGLGTFKIKGIDLVKPTLEAAIASGYRSIDSATVYKNENDIAISLQNLLPKYGLERADIFITSKLGPADHGAVACQKAVHASLQHFNTDYLDLYLIHWPGTQKKKPEDPENARNRKESWLCLEKMCRDGKLRSIGVSNYNVRHMKELLSYCTIKPAVLQSEYHPHLVQSHLVEVCRENDIHFQAYSSLGTSSTNNQLLCDEVVREIAVTHERTPAQILLRWAVQHGIGVIPKSTNPAHIKQNIEIFDFELSEKEMKSLSRINKSCHYAWDSNHVL